MYLITNKVSKIHIRIVKDFNEATQYMYDQFTPYNVKKLNWFQVIYYKLVYNL